MPRPITLYITVPLADDYRRRREMSPVTRQILAQFPCSCSKHRVPVEVAGAMLRDARYWGWGLDGLSSPQVMSYRSLVYQITRCFEQRSLAHRREETIEMLRWVVYVWVCRLPAVVDA